MPLKPHQRLCLWTPRRVFDPLDTHFAIELSALSGYARVLIRARRREIPCLRKRATRSERHAIRSRPSDATICKEWIKQLGGAPAGAQSYWQGRFAACTFVGGFLGIGRPRNSWGVAPNPTRELRPLTPQGTLSLDPFWLPGLGALPLLLLFRRFFCLFLRFFLLIQGFFPIKHLPHLPLRFLHHPVALLNRVLLRVVINLRPE